MGWSNQATGSGLWMLTAITQWAYGGRNRHFVGFVQTIVAFGVAVSCLVRSLTREI